MWTQRETGLAFCMPSHSGSGTRTLAPTPRCLGSRPQVRLPRRHQCLLGTCTGYKCLNHPPFLSSFPPTSSGLIPDNSILPRLFCSRPAPTALPSPVSRLHGTFLALPVNTVSPHSPCSPKGQCGFNTLGLGTTVHVRVVQLALNVSILFLRCSPDHPCN